MLPQPPGGHAVTTDGQLLNVALRKYQCYGCALLQSDPSPVLVGDAFSYESTYDFYNKPLMRVFDDTRYRSYADWVASFLVGSGARRVLEVGCGEGWVLQLLQDAYPSIRFQGLEPSAAAVRRANAAGLDVSNGTAESNDLPAARFDFVYCINVLEHVADPIGFVKSLSRLLGSGGHVLVICSCGNVIDSELMFVDRSWFYEGERNYKRGYGTMDQTSPT